MSEGSEQTQGEYPDVWKPMSAERPAATDEQFTYCQCYGDPEGSPLCDECAADEREQDELRAEEMFREDVMLYGI